MLTEEYIKLYIASKDADNAFNVALVKEYGKRSGDMRYRPDLHTPEIKTIGDLKKKADSARLAYHNGESK